MNLRVAKVVGTHPEHRAVDLVYLDSGWRASGVLVVSPDGSTNTGSINLPEPVISGDKWDPKLSGDRDMLALVGTVGDRPVVLGFITPQVCQMSFRRKNFAVHRYPSDVYTMVDGDGNTELYHPSGTYVRIGQGTAHEDLTGKDFDGQWKLKKGKGATITISANGGKATLVIAPNGGITVTSGQNMTVNAAGTMTFQAAQIKLN